MDNFIQRINPHPGDKIGAFFILVGQQASFIHWIVIYPLDKVIHSLYNRAQYCALLYFTLLFFVFLRFVYFTVLHFVVHYCAVKSGKKYPFVAILD